jgi:hypothetical protein
MHQTDMVIIAAHTQGHGDAWLRRGGPGVRQQYSSAGLLCWFHLTAHDPPKLFLFQPWLEAYINTGVA